MEFIFICDILVPIIMLVGGYLMAYKTPKNINGVYGYRTTRSKKNKETWKFANEYCGKLWLKWGVVVLAVSIIAQLPFIANEKAMSIVSLILCTIQILVLIMSIKVVDDALKEKFPDRK